MGDLLHLVGVYYAACDSGDAERIADCFAPGASHYYQRMDPHHGPAAIGEHFGSQARELEGRWAIENGIEQGDQAVVEWTMTWRSPRTGERRLDRGTDWFLFRGRAIVEVRCYHHSSPDNRSGDLVGFDHVARGHVSL